MQAVPLAKVFLAKIYDVIEVNIVSRYLTRYNIVPLFIPQLHHLHIVSWYIERNDTSKI